MATARPIASTPFRRRTRRALFLAVLLAAALLAWNWRPLRAEAAMKASYDARIACSCRFVAGRPLSNCRDDLAPGTAFVFLGEDVEERSVTARVPLLASQTATFREGQGCRLEPWDN